MDSHTLRVLEFDRVREQLAEHVSCELGRAHVDALTPEVDAAIVEARQAETTECRSLLDDGYRLPFGGLSDSTELIRRAAAGAVLQPEELLDAVGTLETVRRLRDALAPHAERARRIHALSSRLGSFPEIEQAVHHAIGERGEVLDRASAALGRVRNAIRIARSRLTQRVEGILRESAYRHMLQDQVLVQRAGRICIPIKVEYRSQFPGLVHDQSSSGQTVFMEPAAALEASNELRTLELDEQNEIHRILQELSVALGSRAGAIQESLQIAGVLDFIHARASYSYQIHGVRPHLAAPGEIALVEARHPLLEGDVVPLDIVLGDSQRTIVVTGPNTGGKTVALKTTGLLCLMFQAGLHIPASPRSRLSLFPRVFADIGDEQSIQQSLSTFSSHLRQIVKVVENLQPMALVLLDEVGAGTDPVEGSALAATIVEHLTHANARTIVTTHYGELKELAFQIEGVENASMQFDEESLAPTYRLQIGVPGRSLALVIAARLGLSETLIQKAKQRVRAEELSTGELLRQLERDRKATEDARREAERDAAEARRLKDRRERELADFDRRRKQIIEKSAAEAQEAVRQARDQARLILAELREAAEKKGPTHTATEALGQMDRELSEVRHKIAEQPRRKVETSYRPSPGENVFIGRFRQVGTVLEVGAGDEALVAMGAMKMRLPVADLEPGPGKPAASARSSSHDIRMQKAAAVASEIKLLGLRSEEAIHELDRYLDDALLAGTPQVRVIHGKGTGALKHAVWEWLRGHHAVESYRIGGEGEGGAGATVVELVKD